MASTSEAYRHTCSNCGFSGCNCDVLEPVEPPAVRYCDVDLDDAKIEIVSSLSQAMRPARKWGSR